MAIGKSYEVTTIMYGYENYQEHSAIGRYVPPSQVKNYIKKLDGNPLFEIRNIGSSFEGREINLIKLGTGKTKVFFWSQMHGDESTSTRAILDLLNFFASNDENQAIRDKILHNVTLYIIPMLNQDGAEKFTRRNAQLIDINRDAIAQQTPEGKLLYEIKNEINPDWGFNLHDQSSGYSAGLNYKSSTISLLAPPFNKNIDLNDTREKAMKLIVSLFNELSEVIPGHIARYDDEFEPRAFGDNFTKDGVSTVLIEAGGWCTDPDREYVRKIFFLSLIKSLLTISDQSYVKEDYINYFSIPENKEILYDLLLRNVTINKDDKKYTVDIAIKREPLFDAHTKTIFYKGIIADIGDLSIFYGYDDFNMSEYSLQNPKFTFDENVKVEEMLKQGFLFVRGKENNNLWTHKPINYLNSNEPKTELEIDALANFFLVSKGITRYVVINGFMIDINKSNCFTGNGLVLG